MTALRILHLGGRFNHLHAPFIVGNAEVQQALLEEQSIRETLQMARKADVAVVDIGSVEPNLSSLIRAGYIDEKGLGAIRQSGAVGVICARQFDIRGEILDIELNQRVVGIDCASLKQIKCAVGVAGAMLKAPAILGALHGELIDVLLLGA